ncbi:hypothetical protein J5834_01140 [bacterium]|nr:hypothetical protein [bacterium]
MKKFYMIPLFLFFMWAAPLSAQDKLPEGALNALPPVPVVELPADYDELVKKSNANEMVKKVDRIVGNAVRKSRVVIEKLNDFIFLQVVPNYAYTDEGGEERLGEDLMAILNSNAMEAPRNSQFMTLDYTEMRLAGLPFKKLLVDSLVLKAESFDQSISLTFFINVNKLTNMVLNSLENVKDFSVVFNQAERFYRAKVKDSKLLYFVRIPNIAYEIVYTGEMYEVVISKSIKEALFLKDVLAQTEREIEKNKNLTFDGRYIKGKEQSGISIDLWFLADKCGYDLQKGVGLVRKALKGEPVRVWGSEKESK